jgi:hypothetical protein
MCQIGTTRTLFRWQAHKCRVDYHNRQSSFVSEWSSKIKISIPYTYEKRCKGLKNLHIRPDFVFTWAGPGQNEKRNFLSIKVDITGPETWSLFVEVA